MNHSGTLRGTDRFYFPEEVTFRSCKEGWLVVSTPTANWLVLPTNFQKTLMEHLLTGATIGEICSFVTNPHQQKELQQLLAAITAREFGSTYEIPTPIKTDITQQITCYLTNACNLRCDHCFMHSGTPLADELKKEEWLRILTDFSQQGGKNVTFTGGEPLMNHEFEAILKHTHHLGLTATILSNGILWTEETIKRLTPYISEIQISIDGFDEPSNAKVRGAGYFDKVVANIIRFANTGIRTSVATTFTFQNIQKDTGSRYRHMVDYIKSQCQHPIFFKLSKKILQGRNTHYTEEENRIFYDYVMKIEHSVNPDAQFTNFILGHTPNSYMDNCGFGGISIGANGDVFYCNRLLEMESYGNIKGQSIKPFLEQGKQLHELTSVENLQPCATCHLRYICGGGCRIDECNFQGKLKNHKGALLQTKCDKDTILQLERKMIDSYLYYYKF